MTRIILTWLVQLIHGLNAVEATTETNLSNLKSNIYFLYMSVHMKLNMYIYMYIYMYINIYMFNFI